MLTSPRARSCAPGLCPADSFLAVSPNVNANVGDSRWSKKSGPLRFLSDLSKSVRFDAWSFVDDELLDAVWAHNGAGCFGCRHFRLLVQLCSHHRQGIDPRTDHPDLDGNLDWPAGFQETELAHTHDYARYSLHPHLHPRIPLTPTPKPKYIVIVNSEIHLRYTRLQNQLGPTSARAPRRQSVTPTPTHDAVGNDPESHTVLIGKHVLLLV